MQISFDKEPMKGTQLEKLLPALLSVKKGGGVAGRLLFILMECASGQMLALSAAHIIHTASQDVIRNGNWEGAGKERGEWGWLVYGHANWLVQRQHNHITFYTRRWAAKNATAAASLLYFRGNQIATNSIGRTRLSAV